MNKLVYFLLVSSSTMAQKCGENSLPECQDWAYDVDSFSCAGDKAAKTALSTAATELSEKDMKADNSSWWTTYADVRAIQCLKKDLDDLCGIFEGYNAEIKPGHAEI